MKEIIQIYKKSGGYYNVVIGKHKYWHIASFISWFFLVCITVRLLIAPSTRLFIIVPIIAIACVINTTILNGELLSKLKRTYNINSDSFIFLTKTDKKILQLVLIEDVKCIKLWLHVNNKTPSDLQLFLHQRINKLERYGAIFRYIIMSSTGVAYIIFAYNQLMQHPISGDIIQDRFAVLMLLCGAVITLLSIIILLQLFKFAHNLKVRHCSECIMLHLLDVIS